MACRKFQRGLWALWAGTLAFMGPALGATTSAALSVDSALLNADLAQLQQSVPQLQKLAKPMWGPGGMRGLWTAPPVKIASYAFTPVFYFQNGRVQRLEYRWRSDAHPCLAAAVFDDVVRDITNQWGDAVSAEGTERPGSMKSALWVANSTDLIAYIQDTDMRCSVLLVNRPRQLKDAGAL